ncbi:MAG: IPT/TIG domain-containing protein [Capsulimonas sp.]|uniref:IPT/TIG domain-containing protein n=1 Tax=Capsulimonas sp. TaxID=2494211 RepID=UPI003265B329
MKNRIAVLAVIFGTLAMGHAEARDHVLVDVPSTLTNPTQITNDGDILGTGMDGNTPYAALLHNGALVRLPTFNPAIAFGNPNGYHLNNKSQVLYFGYTNGTSGDISTFVLDLNTGTTTDIGHIPGFPSTIGWDINDSGDVIGYAYSNTQVRPFVWRKSQFGQLPPLAGAPAGATYQYSEINNHGHVLGRMLFGNGQFSYLIWQNGAPSVLHVPTPVNDAVSSNQIFKFNDLDQVLTTYHDNFDTSSSFHILTLATPPIVDQIIGMATTEVFDFNNRGQVLERWNDPLLGPHGSGWIYYSGTDASLIEIPQNGRGYNFFELYGFNDNGDILGKVYQIGGDNIDKNVVLMTVPEPAPQITSITPDRTVPGAPTMPVTIYGTNFYPDTTVTLNGAEQASSHYVSPTIMRVVLLASALANPGVIAVRVVTAAPGGGPSNTKYFNVAMPRATILNINPNRLFPGAGAAQITINGLDFDPGAVVTVNDTYTITPTFVSPYQLTAIVPSSVTDTAGSYFVRVVNPGWSNASTPAPLTVALPAPIISLITPDRIGAGLTSLKLSIYGPYYYQPTAKVSFNGGAPVTPEAITGTRITVSVPSSLLANPGNIAVRVVDSFANGGASAPATLVVSPRPALTSLTPNHATVGSGVVTVTLTGSNFEASSTVTINNGTAIAATFVSPTQLTVTIPSSVTAVKGNYVVRVVNTGYSNFSNPQAFTVTP